MHIRYSDQNVQEATKLLGPNGDNRPNWEVPKLWHFFCKVTRFSDTDILFNVP
jgi:hypothetical protein